MEPATRLDQNHQLTIKDFPYIVQWRDDRCKRCGRCTAVCPMFSIEPSVVVQRTVVSEGHAPGPKAVRRIITVIKQSTEINRYCTGCGTCTLVCPNDAIETQYNPQHKFLFHKTVADIHTGVVEDEMTLLLPHWTG